jgi:hypothetical protein
VSRLPLRRLRDVVASELLIFEHLGVLHATDRYWMAPVWECGIAAVLDGEPTPGTWRSSLEGTCTWSKATDTGLSQEVIDRHAAHDLSAPLQRHRIGHVPVYVRPQRADHGDDDLVALVGAENPWGVRVDYLRLLMGADWETAPLFTPQGVDADKSPVGPKSTDGLLRMTMPMTRWWS